jgi:hypothetical protein
MLQTYGIADFVDRQKYQMGLAIACRIVAKHQGKIEVNC